MLAWKQPFIQRVRNSSLVEELGMDNNRVSNQLPKPWDHLLIGRGAFQSASKAQRELLWSVWKSKCRYK